MGEEGEELLGPTAILGKFKSFLITAAALPNKNVYDYWRTLRACLFLASCNVFRDFHELAYLIKIK